jgi:hypothetical protein
VQGADVDRFPPEQGRVEGAGQVILPDLAVVEAPAVVLVLLVAVPPRSVADAEVEVVPAEAGRGARFPHPAHEDVDVVLGERPLELRDLPGEDCGFGEQHGVDRPFPLGCGLQQAIELAAVEARFGHELEQAEPVGFHVREPGVVGPPEVLGRHGQGPGKQEQPVSPRSFRGRSPAPPADVDGFVREREVA